MCLRVSRLCEWFVVARFSLQDSLGIERVVKPVCTVIKFVDLGGWAGIILINLPSHLSGDSYIYQTNTGCNRRNGPDFRRVFLRSNYTDITENTYIQS